MSAAQFRREVVPAAEPYFEHLPSLRDDAAVVSTLHQKVTALASLHQLAIHPSLARIKDAALHTFTVRNTVDEITAAQKKAQLLKEIRTHLKVGRSACECGSSRVG